jgi:hypothetical protein
MCFLKQYMDSIPIKLPMASFSKVKKQTIIKFIWRHKDTE